LTGEGKWRVERKREREEREEEGVKVGKSAVAPVRK
jgi:hypothetical protein